MHSGSLSLRLLAALGGVVLSAACSGGVDPDVPEPAAFGDLPAGIDYVALGDSYSAGPLVTTVRSDPSGCVRSTDNYPAFLAGWLSVESYTDVTCTAADTRDLTGRQRLVDGKSVAPQLEALSDDTDLVTLGIGGNDFSIYSTLIDCIEACSDEVQQLLLHNAVRVERRVAGAVREITERAPEAEVFVVGYPRVLPERRPCRAAPLTPAGLKVATEVADRLNDSLRSGAETAGAAYVDVDPASQGHDVCAGRAAWINGPKMRLGIAAPFHPVLAGMRGVAAEVFRSVTGDDAPEAETASPPQEAVVRNPVPSAGG